MGTETNQDSTTNLKDTADLKQIQKWEWEGGSIGQGTINTETSTFLPSLLTRDYELMDEATRRLLEGTCCLLDEDKDSAFELFSKLKVALMDHIYFEEETVFKSLKMNSPEAVKFISTMKAEHRELQTLIKECMRELQESHGVAFRIVLREFLAVFRRHRILEMPFWYTQEAYSSTDENLKRMLLRVEDALI